MAKQIRLDRPLTVAVYRSIQPVIVCADTRPFTSRILLSLMYSAKYLWNIIRFSNLFFGECLNSLYNGFLWCWYFHIENTFFACVETLSEECIVLQWYGSAKLFTFHQHHAIEVLAERPYKCVTLSILEGSATILASNHYSSDTDHHFIRWKTSVTTF